MTRTRTMAACIASVEADRRAFNGDPEWMPTLAMNRQVAQARREMGEARWNKLNQEWEA